jgi:pyrroloquinoline quinone (PQQ) biosynthesis protein C
LGHYYYIYHPFNVLLNSGRASVKQIRAWVDNRFYYQATIPIKDAAILANCDDRDVRREWVLRTLTDLFAPPVHRERLATWPLRYPWIENSGLEYFRSRVCPLAQTQPAVVDVRCSAPARWTGGSLTRSGAKL